MTHISIAILKKQIEQTPDNKTSFVYLVNKNHLGHYEFLHQQTSVICGGFNYTGFKNFLIDYLILPVVTMYPPDQLQVVLKILRVQVAYIFVVNAHDVLQGVL